MAFPDPYSDDVSYRQQPWRVRPQFPSGRRNRTPGGGRQGVLMTGGPTWSQSSPGETAGLHEESYVSPMSGNVVTYKRPGERGNATATADRRRWMAGYVADGRVGVAFKQSHVPDIVASGQFLTQHDTGHSNGIYDPEQREYVEYEFGWDKPIYGQVVPRGRHPETHGYGNLVAFPREGAHPVTVSDGDTLDNVDMGMDVSDLSRVRSGRDWPEISYSAAEDALHRGHQDSNGYVEAQIHSGGSLPLSDISEVRNYGHLQQRHREALQEAGVKVTDHQSWYQPPLGLQFAKDKHGNVNLGNGRYGWEPSGESGDMI